MTLSVARTVPGRAPRTSASASPVRVGASIQSCQPPTSSSPHWSTTRVQAFARALGQAAERVAVEVQALGIVDHEPVAERRERIGGVERGDVLTGHSHASTAFQSGLSGSMWPKWSSSGSTSKVAPLASAKRCEISTGHDVVEAAVGEQGGNAEREPLDRRGQARRLVAQELLHDVVGEVQLGGALQVQHTRLRDHLRHRHQRVLARRRPGRQMAAGGVADRDHAREVDIQRGQEVDRVGHVLERGGHATAVAQPPVLDVPRRPAARREVLRERVHQRQVVAIAPEPAVDEDRDRPLAVQHAVLRGVVAVVMPLRHRGTAAPRRAW